MAQVKTTDAVATASAPKTVSAPSNPSAGSAHAITHTQRATTTSSTNGRSTNGGSVAANAAVGPNAMPSKDTNPSGNNRDTGLYDYDWNSRGGSSGGGSSGGGASAQPQKTPEEIAAEKQAAEDAQDAAAKEELAKNWADAAAVTKGFVDKAQPDETKIGRVDHVDDTELRNMLQQIVDAQKQQTEQRTDYTVQQGVNELNRAVEDAAQQFQTERDQVSADEAQALDNQALYAEMRGDRGGIGQAQYNSIQNTAATNRLKVNQAQTKLSTDTARQIADLRAQGEFEKADALLSITQSYLSELKSLEQWALQTNLSVDEFNIAVDEWEKEFNQKAQQFLINTELSTAQVTGAFANGTPTLAAKEQMREQMAQLGQTMIELGITPTPAQIEAMGLTNEQYQEYAKKMKKSGGGGGGSGNTLEWAGNIKYEWLHPESKVSDAVTATSSAAAGGTTDYVAALNAANS